MLTTRSKEEGNISGNVANWTEHHEPTNGDPPYDKTFTATLTVDYYRHTGVNTPNYHKRKKAGELLPITDWHQFELDGKVTSEASYSLPHVIMSSTTNRDVTSKRWLLSEAEILSGAADFDYHSLGPSYITMAAAKIYSSGFDGLTFLAELHKSIRMFRNFGKNLLSAAKTGKLENSWLEGRYGWRILVFEMFELHQTLCELDLERKRWRESAGYTDSSSSTEVQTRVVGGFGTYTYVFRDTKKIGIRGTVAVDALPPKFQFNPITTAWELIPYSFVIDWFVNVGAWLSSLSLLAIQTNRTAGYGIYYEHKRELLSASLVCEAPYTAISCSGTSNCVGKLTNRHSSSVPFLPSIRVRLDVGKITDLIALVLQTLRRK